MRSGCTASSDSDPGRGHDVTAQNPAGGTRFLTTAAALVIVVAGLRAAAPFLVPLVLALFLAVINLPVLQRLRRVGVPTPAAVLAVVLLTFGFLGLLGLIGFASLSEIRGSLPLYVNRFQAFEHSLLDVLESWGVPVPGDVYAVVLSEPSRIMDLAGGVVRGAANLLSYTGIVALYVIFMLLEGAGFPDRLRATIGRGDADLSRYARAIREIQRYLAIKTIIGLATGGLIALWLWIIGVDFPLLWGAIAFLLNYIPNVGSLVAAAPAVLFALLQVGPGSAALATAGYLAVNVVLGNVIEPQVMGRGFGLSTLVVVISLVFWGWLWGPIGMLLSVPLTVVMRIALEHTPDLAWLAKLLGGVPHPQAATTGAGGATVEAGPAHPAPHVSSAATPSGAGSTISESSL